MNAAQYLKIQHGIEGVILANCVDANNEFIAPTEAQDAQIAVQVEQVLVANGIVVPSKIQKMTQAIALALEATAD